MIEGRTASAGALRVAWCALDLAAGTETPRESWEVEVTAGKLARAFALPEGRGLRELSVAWSSPGGAALELSGLALHEAAAIPRPSIVLIVIDTLSANHLSAYGYPLETDPELARFAAESFLFEHCYTNAPWTVPSFMSLMTGLYARAHEVVPAAGTCGRSGTCPRGAGPSPRPCARQATARPGSWTRPGSRSRSGCPRASTSTTRARPRSPSTTRGTRKEASVGPPRSGARSSSASGPRSPRCSSCTPSTCTALPGAALLLAPPRRRGALRLRAHRARGRSAGRLRDHPDLRRSRRGARG